MTNYYVASTGNDSNNGLTLGSAWLTLAHAHSVLVAGDTCSVLDGTYTLTSSFIITTSGTSESARITYASLNHWGAKLVNTITVTDAQSDATVQINADYIDFTGFDVSGSGRIGIFNSGSSTGSGSPLGSHNRIRRNYVHDLGMGLASTHDVAGIDFGRYGSGVYNAILNEASGNILHNIGNAHNSSSHGIYFGTAYGVIQNNTVSGTPGYGINASHFSNHMTITNNLVFNCGDNSLDPAGGAGGGIYITAGGAGWTAGVDEPHDFSIIANNTVKDCIGWGGILEDANNFGSPNTQVVANNTFSNNCCTNNVGVHGNVELDSGALNQNPLAPPLTGIGVTDTFIRANTAGSTTISAIAGWGNASDGHTWSSAGGSPTWSIASNQGKVTNTNTDTFALLATTTYSDAEVLVRLSTTSANNGNWAGLTLRYSSPSSNYTAHLNFNGNLRLFRNGGGTQIATTPFAVLANTEYWLRFRAVGSTLSAKVWADGTNEPASWTLTATDTNYHIGQAGIFLSPDVVGTVTVFDSYSIFVPNPLFPYLVRYQIDGTGDYHLQSISPCISAGTSTGAPANDLDGNPRPFGHGYDIGPYEYSLMLAINIGRNDVLFDEDTFALSLKLDERWRFQFTVLDYAGTQQYSYRQQVIVTDAILGVLFAGFVADVKQDKTNMYPGPGIEHQIDCIDMRALVDKRTSNWFYANQQAGVIAVHQVQKYLAAEGITAAAALRWDEQLTDWQAGTLTNTVATTNAYDSNPGDGDLELAAAGTAVTKTESTTANWNAGTLTGVQALNNQLTLASHSGLSFSASCSSGFGNAFAYYKIWDSSYLIKSGDFLGYKVWINSDSPQIMAGIDAVCTDGTTIRDFNSNAIVDQNGIIAHPKADLSGFANDQWYYRKCDLSAMAGKTLNFATAVFEGDNGGTYQAYFYDVQIENSSGVTQQNLYGDAGTFHSNAVSLNTLKKVSSNGYGNVMLTTLLVYESTGTRISPSTSIAAAGIYRSSQIDWAVTLPDTTALTMYTSIDDGGTWQQATSLSAIANLLAGASLTSRTVKTKQVLSLTGKDPTVSPQLKSVIWTVMPSYVATKSDTKNTFDTQANWNTGTLTNLTATTGGDLTIKSYQKNWDDASTANQTLFGAGTPAMGTLKQQATLATNTVADAKARLDSAGTWTDFTMSVDVQITDANLWAGLVYRTTGWVNARDTFAYKADINLTGVFLDRATNGGASSPVTIGSAPLSLTVGDWHTLTVVVAGSLHKVYVDGVLYITQTDATYAASGNVGIILNNSTGARATGIFDNFGIMATPGVVGGSPAPQWVSSSLSLGSITVGNSIVFWDADALNGAIIAVLASVNGGTFNACTNGGIIPGLTPGTVLTGGTVQYKVQLQSPTAQVTPMFHGLTSWVLSSFSSSGTRISPALSLAPVGSQAGTALVNWNANLPPNTGLLVQTSLNGGSTYQTVSAPGNAIPNITTQPTPWLDTFSSDTHTSYTSTFDDGGSAGTWTYDTANSRI
ncbi:MAG: choice-of-anchor Q domain-containing protein, partial [Ktedonobacteraceae bacterium]